MFQSRCMVSRWDKIHRWRRDRIQKYLGKTKYYLTGFGFFTKIEAHSDMDERMVRDLAIEWDIQIEAKDTPTYKNQPYVK